MSKTLFVNFKAVKAAVSMEQVLDHYSILHKFKKKDGSLSGPCPIHKGSNPTQFRVNLTKNIWNCFSECKRGGNVLDFISEMEHVSIHGAALKAIEWFKLDSEQMSASAEEEERTHTQSKPEHRAITPALRRHANGEAAQQADSNGANKPLQFRLEKLDYNHPYLAERGLLLETIIDFGTGFCAKGVMAGRIAIPIHNAEGKVVAYAGRFPGEASEETPKYKLPQGFRKSLELFNIDRALKEPPNVPLVIVEGFFDCMRLHQYGYKKVVALMGSTLSEAQEALVHKHMPAYGQILVMLDEDEAGIAGRKDIAARLSRFCFVKIHEFSEPGMQPEYLEAAELRSIVDPEGRIL